MKKLLLTAAMVPALMGLAACGDRSATDNTNTVVADDGMGNDTMLTDETMTGNEAVANDATANEVGSAANLTAQSFANTMAASDMFEIESAKVAQDKATAPELKKFAAQMIKDHTASTAKLKTAAASANVTPAPALTGEQTANLAALRAASGTEFDTLYKQQQAAAHQQALANLQGYASNGDAPALKTFASNTAKVVEMHLKEVQGM
jgi:putative membrane protein